MFYKLKEEDGEDEDSGEDVDDDDDVGDDNAGVKDVRIVEAAAIAYPSRSTNAHENQIKQHFPNH